PQDGEGDPENGNPVLEDRCPGHAQFGDGMVPQHVAQGGGDDAGQHQQQPGPQAGFDQCLVIQDHRIVQQGVDAQQYGTEGVDEAADDQCMELPGQALDEDA